MPKQAKTVYPLIFVVTTVFIILFSCGIFIGCENSVAKYWGGTMTVDLPKGVKLINVTWKDTELWYFTREMKSEDLPETYTFQEKSPTGLLEGTVILRESK